MPKQNKERVIVSEPKHSPPKLRPYQEEVIKDLYKELNAGRKRVAIVAGTGAGKTIISGQICAHAEAAGKRLIFLVHLDVLVGQTYEKMKAFGLQCGFIKADWEENRDAPIQIASIQTMAQRPWWRRWPADIVFYDEGHITLFSQVGKEVLTKTHANAIHLVMTATPLRLGKEQLGDYLDTLVSSPVPSALQEMGYLSTMKYYSVPRDSMAKLEGVQTSQGDYDERDLKNACDRAELVEKIIQEWFRIGKGKRTIAFCVDVEHANHVAEAFRRAGIAADTVDGSTSIKDRNRLYQALKTGELMVLTSCNVISIGFDEPSVEVGLMLRPTMSSAMHFQQLGRVMRISPQTGKEYGIILDQAGNLQRLGFPEDVENYSLPTKRDSTSGGGIPPTKPCPACGRLVLNFIVKCPDCSHQWIGDRPVNTEDMVEIYSNTQAQQIRDIPILKELYHGHRRRAYKQGRDLIWADRAFADQCGREPNPEWCFGSLYGSNPTFDQQINTAEYLQQNARKRGESTDDWFSREFEKEFGPGSWLRFSAQKAGCNW